MLNKQQILVSRPDSPASEPGLAHFKLVCTPLPVLAEGEALVRNHYLSLDPYMRGRMLASKSYTQPQPLNEVMIGATVGEVIDSRHPDFPVGCRVMGDGGWQQFSVLRSDAALPWRRIDTTQVPPSAYLGAVGLPGVTAWYGMHHICLPEPKQTIAVSAASGAVGSAAGQLAKAAGCRVIGFAGGAEKCRIAIEEFGFDACIDYKAHPDLALMEQALRETAPTGVDAYFDNVGGLLLDAVLGQMNAAGRVAVCGALARFGKTQHAMQNLAAILTSRLRLQGFVIAEHLDLWPDAVRDLSRRVAAHELKYRETIAHGIEAAPGAFLGLLRGKNIGKQLVQLS